MYKRTIFGNVTNTHVAEMDDVNKREFLILAVLAIAVIVMGVCPDIFVAKMHTSVGQLINQVALSKI